MVILFILCHRRSESTFSAKENEKGQITQSQERRDLGIDLECHFWLHVWNNTRSSYFGGISVSLPEARPLPGGTINCSFLTPNNEIIWVVLLQQSFSQRKNPCCQTWKSMHMGETGRAAPLDLLYSNSITFKVFEVMHHYSQRPVWVLWACQDSTSTTFHQSRLWPSCLSWPPPPPG